MKRIYHVHGGTFRNYGDMAIKHSMQSNLSAQSSIPLQFIDIDLKNNQAITEEMVDVINQTGDMLLVGGGGLIMSGDGFDTRSGWQFNISEEDLCKLRVPLVIYGAGYNVFPGDVLSDRAKSHIHMTAQKAELFSCRDESSKLAIQIHADLEAFDISVIPDPAMFVDVVDVELPGLTQQDFLIGVSLAGDRLEKRFTDPGTWNNFVEILCYHLKNTCEFFGGKVLFIPHISEYDIKLESFFRALLPEEMFYSVSENMPWLYPESVVHVPTIAGIYSQLQLCLGMRGHSLIIPYGQETSVIGLSTHNKVDMFCQEYGVPCCGKNLDGLHGMISASRTKDPNNANQREKLIDLATVFVEFNESVLDILNV